MSNRARRPVDDAMASFDTHGGASENGYVDGQAAQGDGSATCRRVGAGVCVRLIGRMRPRQHVRRGDGLLRGYEG